MNQINRNSLFQLQLEESVVLIDLIENEFYTDINRIVIPIILFLGFFLITIVVIPIFISMLFIDDVLSYIFSLPYRISSFIKEFFHLLISYLQGANSYDMRFRKIQLKEAVGLLCSNLVGLIAPCKAHKMDMKIKYKITPEDFKDAIENGNLKRLQNKHKLLKGFRPHLENTVYLLLEYVVLDFLAEGNLEILKGITTISLLADYQMQLKESTDVTNKSINFFGTLEKYLEEYLVIDDIKHLASVCEENWRALVKSTSIKDDYLDLIHLSILYVIENLLKEVVSEEDLKEKGKIFNFGVSNLLKDENFIKFNKQVEYLSSYILLSCREFGSRLNAESGLRCMQEKGIVEKIKHWLGYSQ